jgi:hypothetical protein
MPVPLSKTSTQTEERTDDERLRDYMGQTESQVVNPSPGYGQPLGSQGRESDRMGPNDTWDENIVPDSELPSWDKYPGHDIPTRGGVRVEDVKFLVDPVVRGGKYDTPLTEEQWDKYQDWAKKSGKNPAEEERDYDLRGFYLTHPEPMKSGEHGKDTFKKPWHPTFSDESKYSTPENPGGKWERKGNDWHFHPSGTNLKYRTREQLQHYFDRYETPDTHLAPEEFQ